MFYFWFYSHVVSVVLSSTLFLSRLGWKCFTGFKPKHIILKYLPHAIDTWLLLSGIILAIILRQIPFQVEWITVKLFAVVIYIILGIFAMHAKTKWATLFFGISATITLIYIICLAITKQPLLNFGV